MNGSSRGFTMIELVIVIAVMTGGGLAFAALFVPQMSSFLALPERHVVQSAASDIVDTIIEGDVRGRGLRYAGRSVSGVLTAADASTLTYHYAGQDGASHTVTIAYDAAAKRVTRDVDLTGALNLPAYGQTADGLTRIVVDLTNTRFFRYYNAAGTELAALPLSAVDRASVRRVDLGIRVGLGAGAVAVAGRPMISLKTGVDIKSTV